MSVGIEDYNIIKDSWEIIKNKCDKLFIGERFSTEEHDKVYPKENFTLLECVNNLIEIPQDKDEERDSAMIKFDSRVYAAFYKKKDKEVETEL